MIKIDQSILNQFQNCMLDAAEFNHKKHIRVAWIYINKFGIDRALSYLPVDLKKFVAHHNAAEKYHQTLTIAAIKTVYHFYLESPERSSHSFLRRHPRLIHNFLELINTHYSPKSINIMEARFEFVKPDLLPFDH